jgi:UDP-N-acetylglucosamine:LPS N-acetylglucosamine transferase
MRDMLIIEHLKEFNTNLNLKVFSYEQGYTYFKKNDFEVGNLDLRLREEFSQKALFKIKSCIDRLKPDFIVADEVFLVLPLAENLGIPSILVTNWFFEAINNKHPLIPVVKKANHIILADKRDFHKIPPNFDIPVSFVGPIIKEFNYEFKDKGKAKKELGINKEDRVILVTPGGRPTERNELLEVSIEVFKELTDKNLKLILLAGELYKEYLERFKNEDKIIVKDFDWEMDRLMVASDIVICKGTFSITWELVYLGVPSISIPDFNNPVDQLHIKKLSEHNATVGLNTKKITPSLLLENVQRLLNSDEERQGMSRACKKLKGKRGQKEAAKIINDYICERKSD